jgi:hypothetical protein
VSVRFSRTRRGGFRVTLTEVEHDVLVSLPAQLRDLSETDDSVRDRLFPRAYLDPTEEDAEQEWRALVHPELARARQEALDRVGASLERAATGRRGRLTADLDADDLRAWLSFLNDSRLAIGTCMGVTEELDEVLLDSDDPRAPGLALYGWLTVLEGDLVETLLGELPT